MDDHINKTEVIVVGNGPSAICLSYFLSGNRPYWNGIGHPNEYLNTKLQEKPDTCILDQNLEYLSEGLEGRSSNPLALLLDALTHPDADMGVKVPSVLRWQHEPAYHIPHIVLGRADPGGAWQQMDGDMQTLSLGNWMELPAVPFREWLACTMCNQLRSNGPNVFQERASISDVRRYYTDYVRTRGLQENFHSHTTVTSVRKVYHMRGCIDSESGEVLPCCKNVIKTHPYMWEVRGYKLTRCGPADDDVTREDFCYQAPNVVLATGTFDIPNRLCVPGETKPWVLHTLKELEAVIGEGRLNTDSDPIVVIGAGLTAADAVIMAGQHGIPVEHVFRRSAGDPSIIFKKLPMTMYPEYHRVHQMMKGKDQCFEKYTCNPAHIVLEFSDDGKVILEGDHGENVIHCSYALVLVGSRPDLSFLPKGGRKYGVVPKHPINCQHNPFDIDPFSYQSISEPGMFAIGPIVGDNFVRFIRGGGFGITNYLWQKKKEEKE